VIPLSFLEPRVEKLEENIFKITLVYTIKDLTESYTLAVGEASKIDKDLSEGLGKLRTDLFNTLYARLKDYLNTIEDIKELEKAVDSMLKQVREAWIEYKRATGLRYEVIESKLPPKSEVFIERRIQAIKTKKYIIRTGSNSLVYYARTPREAQEIDNLLFESPRKGIDYILGKLGKPIDVEVDLEVPTYDIPYLIIYQLPDKKIGLSYNPLPSLGKVDARLYPLTKQKLEELKVELGEDYEELVNAILSVRKIGSKKKGNNDIEEEGDPLEKLFRHIYIIETGLHDSEVRRLLNDLPDYLKVWDSIEADPFLKEFYRSMILPWFTPAYLPHTLIITPTNTGKSTLYKWTVGEDAISDITPITLAGGIDPNTKKPVLGVLHGRDKAFQIESLESNTANETISLLVNYMKSGKIRRGAAGKIFETEGSSPLILTGNPHKVAKAYRLQDWLSKGLLREPQALGSRLLLFYLEEAKPFKYDGRIYGLLEPLREIASSSLIKRGLRKVWDNPRIESWFKEGDSPIELSIGLGKELGDLQTYLEILAREYHVRLKALALNNVLVEYLDKLDEKIEEVLDKAKEKYGWFKQYLVSSINTVLAEHGKAVSETVRAKLLPELLIKTLLGIDECLKAKGLNEGIASIPVKDVLDAMKRKGLIKDYSVYSSRLRKYLRDYDETLEELGIVYSEATDTIQVNIHRFSMIDIEELARELEK